MDELNRVFAASNQGYSVSYSSDLGRLSPSSDNRLAFIQSEMGQVVVDGGATTTSVQRGDLLQIPPASTLQTASPISAIVFRLPGPLSRGIPGLISPDNDPRITDTPGGCAEEEDAYRRICLTWLSERGPYVSHDLNAHRVRITDSFTHFHPPQGGFDEFYLVQSSREGATLLTSNKTALIQHPASVTAHAAETLLSWTPLHAGDLIYLPRGVVHRGLGGAVIHVVAVPGFRPGAEIGVDHHLEDISKRTGVAVPRNAASTVGPKTK